MAAMRARLDEPPEGFTVAEFVAHDAGPGGELLLALRWTDDLGPVVAVGAGGILTEALAADLQPGREIAIVSPTLTPPDAIGAAIAGSTAVRLATTSVRGQPPRLSPDAPRRGRRAAPAPRRAHPGRPARDRDQPGRGHAGRPRRARRAGHPGRWPATRPCATAPAQGRPAPGPALDRHRRRVVRIQPRARDPAQHPARGLRPRRRRRRQAGRRRDRRRPLRAGPRVAARRRWTCSSSCCRRPPPRGSWRRSSSATWRSR